ncbi:MULTISPECIES: DeoR/GlpR family DNA-binding transcription regulator [Lactobacillus]|uniref:DeoR/GlpR family DNA-binding transcription regulator n=1 Tax=Lactobacillus TaxID=1578 RepID=UPI0005144D76|nr:MULTISPECIES: DeoR/GlpR family DNA-binding transcription regulator [Lactobacillus]KGG53383.1 Glycerol-3-phosphate regulon repressor GlpR [Lactobacillus sp. wkB10]MCX0291297.1 DeoR/GlpR family DNA-binding transcription regulator [Lactobacillus kullabergensis]
MLKTERQQMILKIVEQNGKAETNDLVKKFNVTEDTIRKDFNSLSNKGLVKRTHGGVMKIQGVLDYDYRLTQDVATKKKIAKVICDYLIQFKTIFIDSGSTNQIIAEELLNKYHGTIITNSPAIALSLSRNKQIKIEIIGGSLNPRTKVILGTKSINEISQLNLECTLLGVSSIDFKMGITYPNNDEATLKTTLIKQSKNIVVAISKEKLETFSTFSAGQLSDVNALYTDETNKSLLKKYKQKIARVISC